MNNHLTAGMLARECCRLMVNCLKDRSIRVREPVGFVDPNLDRRFELYQFPVIGLEYCLDDLSSTVLKPNILLIANNWYHFKDRSVMFGNAEMANTERWEGVVIRAETLGNPTVSLVVRRYSTRGWLT